MLLPENGRLAERSASSGLELGAAEKEAAEWAFANHLAAGAGTETLPAARARCLPMETRSSGVGVLALLPLDAGQFDAPDQRELLAGFANLAALAIERAQLNEQVQEAVILQTTEKLQTALLNSISHDLRTPLSTVSGAISSLLDAEKDGVSLTHATRLDLLENAEEEADRLNRLVGNLLDMTRLEAGAMRVRKQPCDVQDLIGSALVQASKRLAGHPLETNIPANLPDVPLDFVLMLQVLYNLLDNAAKYSLPDGAIRGLCRGGGRGTADTDQRPRGGHPAGGFAARLWQVLPRAARGRGRWHGAGVIDLPWDCRGARRADLGAKPVRRWGGDYAGAAAGGGSGGEGGLMMDENLLRILVVDDERAIRRYLRTSLASRGYTVVEAAGGEEALRAVVETHPDLVILDLGLPDMDGVEVVRRLREWSQVPIIILSVRDLEDDKVAALDAGADDYLTKPFGLGELHGAHPRGHAPHAIQCRTEPVYELDDLRSTWAGAR